MVKFALAISFAFFSLGHSAVAQEYVNDGKYIYRYTPLSQVKSADVLVLESARIAHTALVSTLKSMKEKGILPEMVQDLADLKKLQSMRKDVDELIDYLNKYLSEERARTGIRLFDDWTNFIPDALLMFVGKKIQISLGKSFGGSVAIGLVVLPAWEEKIEVATGKLVEEGLKLRASLVGWPTGDFGVGLGGGAGFRGGLGFIWDLNKSFIDPEQFWGAGLGASWSTPQFGVGLNFKAGMLSNWEMPGWVDFLYVTAALDAGATAQLSSPHINLTTIISGAEFMGFFEKSQQKAYNESIRELNRKMDEMVRERRVGLVDKDKGSRDHDNSEESEEGEVKPPRDGGDKGPKPIRK